MEPIETITYKGYTIKIHQDDNAESPREWDNMGVMVCFHRNYNLGDKHSFADGNALMEFLETEKPPVVLPLLLLDHSGLWMRTTTFECDSQGWDTSRVGVIYATKETIIKEYGACNEATIKKATAYLQGEVETYSQFLEGDVYGFVVDDEDGKHVDSCWGFYGKDDCLEQAKSSAESFYDERVKKHTAILKAQIKNKVPLSKRHTLGVN